VEYEKYLLRNGKEKITERKPDETKTTHTLHISNLNYKWWNQIIINGAKDEKKDSNRLLESFTEKLSLDRPVADKSIKINPENPLFININKPAIPSTV